MTKAASPWHHVGGGVEPHWTDPDRVTMWNCNLVDVRPKDLAPPTTATQPWSPVVQTHNTIIISHQPRHHTVVTGHLEQPTRHVVATLVHWDTRPHGAGIVRTTRLSLPTEGTPFPRQATTARGRAACGPLFRLHRFWWYEGSGAKQ